MRKRIKKMTACILTALLGLSIMNFPVHAQETQANQQVENNSVSIQNMESLFIGESMFKTAVQALTTLDKNAGPFYVEGDTNGWTYDAGNKTLTFTKDGTYKVTGDGEQTDVQIVVGANITITLTVENVNCHTSDAGMSIDGSSTVTLMLEGKNEFVADSEDNAGIEFNNATGSLTIDGTGSVTAIGGEMGAGIGGENNQSGKYITIKGGTITAVSMGSGAGIGGGMYGSGENITILGGHINASSALSENDQHSGTGAGIGGGGGSKGVNIDIRGGTVVATSNYYGAGIGGGINGEADNITISGGTITAFSVGETGIGGKNANVIDIAGGSVKATAIFGGTSINITPTNGNGKPVYLAKLDITDNVNQIKVDGKDYKIQGKHENDNAYYLYMTEGNHYIEADSNVYFAKWNSSNTSFEPVVIATNDGDLQVEGGRYGIDYIYDDVQNTLTFKKDGDYIVTSNKTEATKERIVVDAGLKMSLTVKNVKCRPATGAGMSIDGSSIVKLVLEGDNKFEAGSDKYAGIEFNNAINGSLIIDGSGSLFAKAGTGGAGIGGSQNATGNNITISGGKITVDSSYSGTGDGCGAGIGSGYGAKGDNHITINNGTVFMNSDNGAGIGSGENATGNNCIIINGGTIDNTTIVDGQSSVGIGSGSYAIGNNIILINEGTINVYGTSGIGSGFRALGDNHITIKGGNITAAGGTGIGSAENSSGTNKIAIQGGVVNAKGNLSAIGDGKSSTFTDIDISGGIVNATSDSTIAIGTVSSGIKYSIRISGGTVTATSNFNALAIGGSKVSTGSIEILGGSVKANGYQTSGLDAISIPPMDGTKNEVYLAILLNQSGVKKIAVDDTDYKISGNHPDGDTNFYLYLTGKNHIITTDQNKYKATWDKGSSTFTITPIAPTPTNITASQTASTITVTEPADAATYGGVKYSIDNQNWQTSNIFDDLDSSKDYTIYMKYTGNNTYIESEVAQKTVKTLSATYTITIPSTTLTAGNSGSKNEIKVSSMDIGYQDKVNVKILGDTNISNDGILTLKRYGASNTITSALFVNGVAFTDINKNIATFTKSNKSPVSISFAKPTQTNIPAGTYNGTVTFGVTYTQ